MHPFEAVLETGVAELLVQTSPDAVAILRSGAGRRALQERGQFWTPDWVARAMAAFVLKPHPTVVFDPAVGAGAFLKACRSLGFRGNFAGCEVDAATLREARSRGLAASDLRGIKVGDFFTSSSGPDKRYPAILSNPPYLRHHRIAAELKLRLQGHARKVLGVDIDGRAGLHVYFLLHCLQRLSPGGRLAFILPADVAEGVFATSLWTWITSRFRLRAVVTFVPEAAPFDGVDTNALIVALENAPTRKEVLWAKMLAKHGAALQNLLENLQAVASGVCDVRVRMLPELIETGLTRPPQTGITGTRLGDIARVMRGIATGANEFFFLTRRQLEQLELPRTCFVRAVGRTRDCTGERLTVQQLNELDELGRPTWLLNLPARPLEEFTAPVRAYLKHGARSGLPERPLIKMRKTWYRVEQREVPPLLFAYLGRRACRFVLNEAACLPLTGFLCVYPRAEVRLPATQLWQALNAPETLEQLAAVGKSYGGGAIKVEPRALERLMIPERICERFGLVKASGSQQLHLMETPARYTSKSSRKRQVK